MNHDIRLRVKEVSCLFSYRLNDFWVAVTRVCHTDATGEVKQFASIRSIDIGAFGAFRDEVEDTSPYRGHVREVLFVEKVRHDISIFPSPF
jgi:hypothetical protein